jgi:hypothetical protein
MRIVREMSTKHNLPTFSAYQKHTKPDNAVQAKEPASPQPICIHSSIVKSMVFRYAMTTGYQLSLPAYFVMSLPTSRCLVQVVRKGDAARRLAALGDTALDVLELDVVGVVGLDIGCKTVEGALDGFLGGRVHHTGLFHITN